jgi:hypothetical protein
MDEYRDGLLLYLMEKKFGNDPNRHHRIATIFWNPKKFTHLEKRANIVTLSIEKSNLDKALKEMKTR